MAQHCKSHTLGRVVGIHRLLSSFLEPVHRFLQPHPALPCLASSTANPHAALALPERFGILRVKRGQPPNIHSWTCLPSWRVVLFPDAVFPQVSAPIPAPFAFG